MNLRRLMPWMLLPMIALVAGACLLASRAATAERKHAVGLAHSSLRSDVVQEAFGLVASKSTYLLALDAFSGSSSQLQLFEDSARQYGESTDRGSILYLIDFGDVRAGVLLDRLEAIGDVPAAVRSALAPIDPETHRALVAGDTKFIDPSAYGAAYTGLSSQLTAAQGQAETAIDTLLSIDDRPPYWRSREFIGFAAALMVFAVLASLLALWRVGVRTRSLRETNQKIGDERDRLASRAEHLRLLISLGRQLSGDADPAAVAKTLVGEVSQVLGVESVALLALRDGRLVSIAAVGPLQPATVDLGAGIAGRAAGTGSSTRVVVAADPVLPGAPGPLSMLASPMVVDGRVVGVLLAAAAGSSELFGQDDEVIIGLVALIGAGALSAAERYGSSLELAMDDPLTGLGNRRRLDRDVVGALSATLGPTAFLMIDIDHFKQFNDAHGHPAGDALLRDVGRAVAGALRRDDIAYRFGGEEFSVLLPDTGADTAVAVAERVRHGVGAIMPPPGVRSVTVSVGVAVTSHPCSPRDLIESADRALYGAKRAGRNRVLLASDVLMDASPVG